MSKTILFQNSTIEELIQLLSEPVKNEITGLKNYLENRNANDDILSRKQTCEFLKIDQSTLYLWQKKGIVKAYGLSNKRYYKRAELIECLIPVKY